MARATFGIPGMRISGELWGAVLATQPNGTTVLRALPQRMPPRTKEQREAEARFKPVAAAWRGLTREEGLAWREFGAATGRQAYPAFTALATKCLQMRPDAPVPRLPPTSAFGGDGIEIVALPPPSGSLLRDEPLGGGGALVFAANGGNAPGVITELLLQRLKSPHRKPAIKEYRSRRFVTFTLAERESAVLVERGTWACAARFVREGTGQEAALVELGVVQVGGERGTSGLPLSPLGS